MLDVGAGSQWLTDSKATKPIEVTLEIPVNRSSSWGGHLFPREKSTEKRVVSAPVVSTCYTTALLPCLLL